MPKRPLFSLLLTVVAAFAIAACGSAGDPIPGDEADALLAELTKLEQEVGAGDCIAADGTLTELNLAVNDLGGGVDKEVRRSLTELVRRLDSLIDQCSSPELTTTTSDTTSTTTTTTETTTDTTEPTTDTTTTDTTTDTTDTTTDTTTTAPGGDDGDGGSGGAGPSSKDKD